jgi:hypothetical protein
MDALRFFWWYEVGTRVAANQPHQGTENIPYNFEERFASIIGRIGNWREGNAATAKHNGRDRDRPGHVKIGGDEIDVVDVVILQLGYHGSEVGYRIDSLKI